MVQVRIFGLVSIFLVILAGVLEADSESIDPWHTFVSGTHCLENRLSTFGQEINIVEQNSMDVGNIPSRIATGKTAQEKELTVLSGDWRSDFLVNDDITGGCYQGYHRVAMDSAGNFVVCWEDNRHSLTDIYAQRFDATGSPQDTAFRVNDDAAHTYQWDPAVALGNAGNYVIVWADWRNDIYGAWDIYAQMYDAAGNPVGVNFVVNDDVGRNDQGVPSVAMDSAGNFVVTWVDYRNGDGDIYAQLYDAAGNLIGVNFRVDDDPGTASLNYPCIAMDPSGNFVVSWYDGRNGDDDIYAQLYDAAGNPVGVNFRVDDDPGTSTQRMTSVAIDPAGNFVVTWQDQRNGNYDIYAQLYDAAGNPVGVNFRTNDDIGAAGQSRPSVAMDDVGNFMVGWDDGRNGDTDIYAQLYDAAGSPVNPNNFMVHEDDVGWGHQYRPSVAIDPAGNSVICFYDSRHGDNDIWAQRFDATGTPIGTNFMVNDDGLAVSNTWVSVAIDAAGSFVVVWYDDRLGAWDCDIFAQLYDAAGNPVGANFRVNDNAPGIYDYAPNVAMAPSGEFVVAYASYETYPDYDVFAQLYDAAGNPVGANFRVNDDAPGNRNLGPNVAMDSAGNFVVAWYDQRSGDYDIYAQMYDATGTPISVNFRVDDDPAVTSGPTWPVVAMDHAGNFTVAWNDDRNLDDDIYAQMYDAAGNPVGVNFRVNDDAPGNINYRPAVAIDPAGSRFVICWLDYRDPDLNTEIRAQFYENGSPVGTNVQINDPDPFPYNLQWSWQTMVHCNGDSLVFAWQDTRRHKGWDIYAKLIDWSFPGIEEDGHREISGFNLRAYPNPFRTIVTVIGAESEFDIYDVSGRLIGMTKDGIWDGKDAYGREAQSGVYFLRAKSSNNEALKVIKLR